MKRITDKANTEIVSNTHPYGDIRDQTITLPGTPVNRDVYTDVHQFFQTLFNSVNKSPNDQLENADNGFQIIEVLGQMISRVINPFVDEKFEGTNEVDFNYDWRSITYGGGYFIRAGFEPGPVEGVLSRSRDGISHEIVYTGVSEELTGIAAGDNGKFMAVGGGTVPALLFSNDHGDTWTSKTALANAIKVAYGGGSTWAVISFDLTQGVLHITNDDGDTWTTFTRPGEVFLDIAFGGGEFGILRVNGTTDQKIIFTSDGLSWDEPIHTSVNNNFSAITYANIDDSYQGYTSGDVSRSGFIAVTDNLVDTNTLAVYGSGSGLESFALNNKQYEGVSYGNGKIVLMSIGAASDANIEQSFDLFRNLNVISNSLTGDIESLVYGAGKFCACGTSRTRTPSIQ